METVFKLVTHFRNISRRCKSGRENVKHKEKPVPLWSRAIIAAFLAHYSIAMH
jgi:hypothetical protein